MNSPRSKGAFWAAMALAATIAVFGPAARGVISRAKERQGALRSAEDIEKRNSNAFAVILGEARATAADLMFIKTERYLDSGVAYQPHIDVDEMAETGRIVTKGAAKPGLANAGLGDADLSAGGHEGHDHHEHEHHVPTVIRTAADDFRGFLGDLERVVKPYRDPSEPHNHTDGRELLPWYRLMTLANPGFIRAYMIGAMWLTQQGKWREARDFVLEGIRDNPDNPELFRLYVSLALLYIKARINPAATDPDWLDHALGASRKAYELALAQRPEGGKIGATRGSLVWRDDLEEEFRFAGRWVAILLREKGDAAAALAAAREFESQASEDGPIKNLLNELNSEQAKTK